MATTVVIQLLLTVLKAGQMGGGFLGGSEPGGSQETGSKVIGHSYILILSTILTSPQAYGKDTLRPVTIKQVLEATQAHPDADFKLDGQEMTQVNKPHTLLILLY